MEIKCPLCNHTWTPPEGLSFIENFAYWKGKLLVWEGNGYHASSGGHRSAIFKKLHDNLGKFVRRSSLFDILYGNHEDGGPLTRTIEVSISRIRTTLKTHKMPFRIVTQSGLRNSNLDDAGYILIQTEEEDASPQHP